MKKESAEIRLGKLELKIMNVVWDMGNATVHDVKETLGKGRKPAYSTILTMMRKIEEKGYLAHDVDKRTFVYRATISREDVRQSILGDILDRVFEGSPAQLMSCLVDQNKISEKELEQIKKLIREAEEDE
jgi:predicted transcriptional regulator